MATLSKAEYENLISRALAQVAQIPLRRSARSGQLGSFKQPAYDVAPLSAVGLNWTPSEGDGEKNSRYSAEQIIPVLREHQAGNPANWLILLVPAEGLEPPTP